MGPARAKRFLMTGQELTAQAAHDLGMFTFLAPPADVYDQAFTFAADLAAGAPNAIAHTKLLCNHYIRDALERTMDAGFALEMLDFRSADHREAVAAFRERRSPHYEGT
jgi:enoyl-CoA hydratase